MDADVTQNSPPTGSPIAEFDMFAGDVLYLPQGWWHSVGAVDEPSLHLTIGVNPDSGIDFLSWIVEQAKGQELFRRRIPRLAGESQRREYLFAAREALTRIVDSKDILDRFFVYADGVSTSRPLFVLPELFQENSLLDSKELHIFLLAPRAAVSNVGDDLVLTALGRQWKLSSATKPLVDIVLSLDSSTVGEAIAANTDVSEKQSADVLFTLLRAGVIAIQ